MRNLLYVLLALYVLFIVFSCGGGDHTSISEVKDGISIVHNPGTPKYSDKTISFKEELAIQAEDDSGNIILYQPAHILVYNNDNIYISDRQDLKVKIFDVHGRHLRSLGTKGEGPGEFQRIGAMNFLPDGRLLVLDYRAQRTSFFDPAGEFLHSHQWRTRHYDIFFTTNTSYTVNENIFGETNQLNVKTYDLDGQEIEFIGSFTPMSMYIKTSGSNAMAIGTPYPVNSIFAGDQERQLLYHCLNDKYEIEVYNHNGDLIRKFDRAYQPLPFTEKDAQIYYDAFKKRNSPQLNEILKEIQLPEVKTITERMGVDDLGNLWVRTNEEREFDGQTQTAYDIFDKDGFYTYRVWTELNPYLFVRGKMYAIVTDEATGFRSVKRYSVLF